MKPLIHGQYLRFDQAEARRKNRRQWLLAAIVIPGFFLLGLLVSGTMNILSPDNREGRKTHAELVKFAQQCHIPTSSSWQ